MGAPYFRSVVAIALLPTHDQRGAAVARAEGAAGPVRQRHVAVAHLDLRMGLAAKLPHRLDHLRQAAAIGGMVVAEPAAVRRSEERRVGKECSDVWLRW